MTRLHFAVYLCRYIFQNASMRVVIFKTKITVTAFHKERKWLGKPDIDLNETQNIIIL